MIRRSQPSFGISSLSQPKLDFFRPPRPKFGIFRFCGPIQCIREQRERKKGSLIGRNISRDVRKIEKLVAVVKKLVATVEELVAAVKKNVEAEILTTPAT